MTVVLSTVLSAVAVAAVVALVAGLVRMALAAGANRQRALQSEQDLQDANEEVAHLYASRDRARLEITRLQTVIRERYGAEARTQIIPAVVGRHDPAATQPIPVGGGHHEAATHVIPAFAEPAPSSWLPNGERLS